ncbi:MAG: hypothetical protein R6V12_20490 [Candidatus Hydrogenedentota bacterium]
MLESSENSNDIPSMVHSPARTSPASWGIPLAGLAAVAVCVVASIMLIRMYIASRPLDIAPANAAMVRHIDDLLTMCQLPESSILRTVPVTRSDEGATWRFHAIDVGVPPTMSAQNVIDTIKEGMALQNVSVSERKGGSAPGVELHFAMLDREFAVVRIMGGAERHDLRPACDELANNVYDVLMNASNVVEVSKTSVEDRQDGPTQWRLYAYRLTGAPGMAPGNLRQLLATSLADVRDEAPEVSFRPNQCLLEVLWRNRPIVRVEIQEVPNLFRSSKKYFPTDPRLIYEESPLLFRSLFGFEPDISGFPGGGLPFPWGRRKVLCRRRMFQRGVCV